MTDVPRFVTNAVKHFKWEPRGKRRLHMKPNTAELMACRPWLEEEIAACGPWCWSRSERLRRAPCWVPACGC